MIDHYTIKLAPAANHKDIIKKMSEGKAVAPEELAKLSKVKVKFEAIGDFADMERLRDLVKSLSVRD